MDLRRHAVEVLRRFIRGEATATDLEAAARRLEASSVGELCEGLVSASPAESLDPGCALGELERRLAQYLAGAISREEASLWVNCLHAIVTSSLFAPAAAVTRRDLHQGAQGAGPALGPTLKLLSLLLDRRHSAPLFKVRSAVLRIKKLLEEGKPVPVRTFLPSAFRDMGTLRLCILENPLAFSTAHRDQWVDVGLMGAAGAEMRLIPLSVFTRRFFLGELPDLVSEPAGPGEIERGRGDPFCYHPENNQAISLKERYPALRLSRVHFQYFVDDTGLAEIVLDVPAIGREEVRFAVKLLCLQNEVRRATLDGRRVSCTVAAR